MTCCLVVHGGHSTSNGRSALQNVAILIEMMVAASLGHEFSVCPLLLHLSILNEDNLIRRLHRLQVVSHHENSATSRENFPQHLTENMSESGESGRMLASQQPGS